MQKHLFIISSLFSLIILFNNNYCLAERNKVLPQNTAKMTNHLILAHNFLTE